MGWLTCRLCFARTAGLGPGVGFGRAGRVGLGFGSAGRAGRNYIA